MRDYWLTKDLLQATGIAFIVLSLVGIGLALALPKKWWGKLLAVIAVGCVIALPVREARRERHQTKVVVDDYKERYAKAKALFDERCMTAGEKINKTVENVEGILLLKVRQYSPNEEQMAPGAAAAHEFFGDDYIRSFLWWERVGNETSSRALQQTPTAKPGYRYVEVLESSNSKRYRYSLQQDGKLQRKEFSGSPTRYAVTFEDIAEPNDRRFWVAGSVIKVIDQDNNEVIAESTRYVLEPGQGSREGQRTPWLFAVGCSRTASHGSYGTRLFVDQVLKPIYSNPSK